MMMTMIIIKSAELEENRFCGIKDVEKRSKIA